MKLSKKLLSLLLYAIMILGSVAVGGEGFAATLSDMLDSFSVKASAASSGTCGDNVTWSLSDDGTLTISGTGNMTHYNSDAPWYSFSSSIKAIVIENGVTSIGQDAFRGCAGLTRITIPDSVTNLGDFAFFGCGELKDIRLSASLMRIGNKAFYECWSLSHVSIPKSVTSIGDYAFAFCENLTEVIFPDSIKSIGDYAFWFCDSLEFAHIPSGVTSIGASIFTGDNIEYPCTVCVCSDSEECLAKDYAEKKGFKFRLCSGHSEEEIVSESVPAHDTIINYSKYNETTQPYRSSITFRAITESGETAEWSVANAEYTVNEDGSCTVKEAKSNFSVTCVIRDSDGNIVCKATETIKIKHDFFDKFIAFFRGLFGLLPDFIQ